MKARFGALIAVLWWVALPASAHRLDEFLQATTIAVEKNQVTVEVRLTPGVAVVRTVLADLDTDGNGIVSEAEQRAYVERVLRDLSLSIDGSHLPLRLLSESFPRVEDMKAGLGEILLTFRADVPRGGPDRRLVFENHYRSGIATYLVNCLFPDDPDIRVSAQSRNYEQSFYQVDYTQAGGAHPVSAPSTSKPSTGKTGPQPNRRSLFAAYFLHGVHHILTGYDHLLFVSALVLAATTLWELLKVVSAFTLAHTITLRSRR